jgi:hypothetical protein
MCAFVCLCFVVCRPILRIGFLRDSNTLRYDGLTVAGLFALDRVLNCEDMFIAGRESKSPPKISRSMNVTAAFRLLRLSLLMLALQMSR